MVANDTDPDGDPLTVPAASATRPTAPPRATANNTVTYTPDPNYNGTDSFTYQACDPAGQCDTATVSVTVTAVNDRAGRAGRHRQHGEEHPGDRSTVLANDVDPDGDTLNVRSFTQPNNGSVVAQRDRPALHAAEQLRGDVDLHLHGL